MNGRAQYKAHLNLALNFDSYLGNSDLSNSTSVYYSSLLVADTENL